MSADAGVVRAERVEAQTVDDGDERRLCGEKSDDERGRVHRVRDARARDRMRVIRLPAAMGGELPGVRYVRDNVDGLALRQRWRRRRKPSSAADTSRLEVAASCATRGLKPEVIMMEPHVMGRLWNADIAKHYEALYGRGHVPPLEQGEGHRRRRRRRGARVLLESGETIDADLVVVGIGATAPVPSRAWTPRRVAWAASRWMRGLRALGPFVEPGSVYAIGDIAAFPLKLTGETVRLEHVKHARDSAAYVGDLIAGKTPPEYDPTPYFYGRARTSRHRTRRQLGLLRRSNRR